MNKRLITAISILVLVWLLGGISLWNTCRVAEKVEQTAKQLQSHPEDTEAVELFEKQWERYERLLSCYLRHSELENIGSSVRQLGVLQKEDSVLFRLECEKVITAARHMKMTDIPYLKNIL